MTSSLAFRLGALLFGIWGATDAVFKIAHYGWDQGLYLWFETVLCLATAAGLWRKNRSLVLAMLAIATLAYSLEIADSLSRLFWNAALFQPSEFLYQPGAGLGELLLSRSSYFVFPVLWLAARRLPRGGGKPLPYLFGVGGAVLAASYFFSEAQNLNCIHVSCFDFANYSGAAYTLVWVLVVTAVTSLAVLGWERLFARMEARGVAIKTDRIVVSLLILAGLVLTGLEIAQKRRLPKLTCAPPFEDSGVRVECLFTVEEGPSLLKLAYSIENKLDVAQYCDTRGDLHGEYEEFKEGLYLRPKEKMKLTTLVPYPEKDAELKVAASCLRLK
jgi:hypothetical protein